MLQTKISIYPLLTRDLYLNRIGRHRPFVFTPTFFFSPLEFCSRRLNHIGSRFGEPDNLQMCEIIPRLSWVHQPDADHKVRSQDRTRLKCLVPENTTIKTPCEISSRSNKTSSNFPVSKLFVSDLWRCCSDRRHVSIIISVIWICKRLSLQHIFLFL